MYVPDLFDSLKMFIHLLFYIPVDSRYHQLDSLNSGIYLQGKHFVVTQVSPTNLNVTETIIIHI